MCGEIVNCKALTPNTLAEVKGSSFKPSQYGLGFGGGKIDSFFRKNIEILGVSELVCFRKKKIIFKFSPNQGFDFRNFSRAVKEFLGGVAVLLRPKAFPETCFVVGPL